MSGFHTVEKIGGTSMTRFGDVMNNVILGKRAKEDVYNRIFVVSAYGGITNLLLENKKTGAPGIYGYFAQDSLEWKTALEKTRDEMKRLNRLFTEIGLDVQKADEFVDQRLNGLIVSLEDLMSLRTFGHFKPKDYLPAAREFLAAVGEAHSAYNSAMILQANGINARFVDLSGWKSMEILDIDTAIKKAFAGIDFSQEMPIVTGYVKCDVGIMKTFDRGYSEITFSKVAVLTDAAEGIIHKEYHLSTGDPKLIGEDKVQVIGHTNFDIADQLSDMDMEAIHSKAAKEMEGKNIPIRIKNAFDPEHPGTLISRDYISPVPRVEMICGRNDLVAVEIHDPKMVGESGYDFRLCACLKNHKINYIAKTTNANTITHFISERDKNLDACLADIRETFPESKVELTKIGIISVIGTNMRVPGFLARAAKSLFDAGINIMALDQTLRQVNIQFMVNRDDFKKGQIVLHSEFVEKK